MRVMHKDSNQQNDWGQQSMVAKGLQQKGQIIQRLRHNRSTNNGNMPQFAIKKKSFRESIRKQYLNNYFQKKREDFFGWIPNSANKQSQNIFDNNEIQHNRFDNNEIQIDKDQCVLQQRINTNYQKNPSYNDNYFKNVILLQKLISCRQQQEMGYEQGQNNFRYNSFYQFIVDIIRQSLDRRYFNRFDDQSIFNNHFHALKNIIYNKLLQQVESFLIDLQNYNKTINKLNTWAYQKMCFDAYIKLILQIQKFIQFQNLISQQTDNISNSNNISQQKNIKSNNKSYQYNVSSHQYDISNQYNKSSQYDISSQQSKSNQYSKSSQYYIQNLQNKQSSQNKPNQQNKSKQNKQQKQSNNNKRWPMIKIQQQFLYLIKILIQITYYDDYEQLYQQTSCQQNQTDNHYYDKCYDHYQQLTTKYNTLFQSQSYSTQQVSITSILLKYTSLLHRLRFIIVFGLERYYQQDKVDAQNKNSYRQYKQRRGIQYKKRRQRQQIILMILILLRNISINIGSDILFEQGIISQIKCILRQQYYGVNIRNKINKTNRQNLKQQQQLQCNNYIVNEKQLFHYKVQLFIVDSFQLVRNQKSQHYLSQLDSFGFVFQQLTHLIRLNNNLKYQSLQSKYQSQYYINNDILFIQSNHYQYHHHQDQQMNQSYQQQNLCQQIYSNHLNYLIQRCISCLQFHLLIKQYYIQTNTQIHIDNLSNTINYNHFQHYLSNKKFIHKFSSNNPYTVKFKCLLFGQKIFQQFQSQSCQQLIRKLPL